MRRREERRANAWVYDEIRADIENLILKPGSELCIQEVAEKLGVSRSPVRDALLRLERDRLVDIFPQKGTRVSFLDDDIIRQERFMRTQIELGVMDRCLSIKRSEKEKQIFLTHLECNLLQQKADIISGNYIQNFQHDDELHRIFYTEAGLERVWLVLRAHTGNEHRVRLLSYQARDIAEKVGNEHEEIVEAIAKDNKAEALRLAKEHLSKLELELEELKTTFPEDFGEVKKEEKI